MNKILLCLVSCLKISCLTAAELSPKQQRKVDFLRKEIALQPALLSQTPEQIGQYLRALGSSHNMHVDLIRSVQKDMKDLPVTSVSEVVPCAPVASMRDAVPCAPAATFVKGILKTCRNKEAGCGDKQNFELSTSRRAVLSDKITDPNRPCPTNVRKERKEEKKQMALLGAIAGEL